MISFVDLIVPIIAATVVTTGPATAPDSAWAARITAAVASLWNAPTAAVRLEWGRPPVAGLPAAPVAYRLLGGTDGWFVLRIDLAPGEVEAMRVRAGLLDTVCVATRNLERGARLFSDDLRREARVRWGGRAVRAAERPAPGWELRRAVVAGSVIERPTAVPPALVQPGDHVELWWQSGELALSLSGVALHSARLGEPVRVRVEGRPRPLTGFVDAPGRARLGTREAS